MNFWEKIFIVFSIVCVTPSIFWPSVWLARLIDYFNLSDGQPLFISMVMLGFILAIVCIIITFRDISKREFQKPNRKVVWALVLLFGGTPGWIVYLFVHGFKPRVDNSQ